MLKPMLATDADLTGWQKLSEWHYRKETEKGKLDWWPTTNCCRINNKNYVRNSNYIKKLLGEK